MTNWVSKEKWDKLWEECNGSPYQNFEFYEIKKREGENPEFITLEEDGNLLAGIFALEKSITFPIIGKKRILVSEGTPLYKDDESLNKILIKFKKIAKQFFYVTMTPDALTSLERQMAENGYKKVSNNTALIDLEKSEEELFQNLEKKSARWGAKFAIKNGLSFAEYKDEKEIEDFFPIYAETAKQGGFPAETKEFISILAKSKIAKLFLIKKDKEIIAGGLIIMDKKNKCSILNLTAVSAEGQKLQAMPFLYWNIIKYSKGQGLKYFDLGGYDLEARDWEKTFQINKFKERFGGELKELPIYSTNWRYSFLRAILKRFRFMKALYKKGEKKDA